MLKNSLPLPSTAAPISRSPSRVRTLLSYVALGTLGVLTITSLFSPAPRQIDIEALDRLIEQDAPRTVIGSPSRPGLSELGAEADESYHLGSVDLTEYKEELRKTVTDLFPKSYQKALHSAIDKYLPSDASSSPTRQGDPISHKIFQTAKNVNPNTYREWQYQNGFSYSFMNDDETTKWVHERFSGSTLAWTWDNLENGIMVRVLYQPQCSSFLLRVKHAQ
jgi:alpha 1,6-mannosyltransferase